MSTLSALSVALILPFEQQAMKEIEESIRANTSADIRSFKAYGDMNVLSQQLKTIHAQNFDVIMPVGTLSSQMTLSLFTEHKKNPIIICTAANISSEAIEDKNREVWVINDKVSQQVIFSAFKPYLKKYGLIYSGSDKGIADIKEVRQYLQQQQIAFEEKVVQNAQDLPASLRTFSPDIEALFIFRDGLLVSSLVFLIEEAKHRQIPLIASDLSSVRHGATLAYAVKDSDIGKAAAALLEKLLRPNAELSSILLGRQAYWAVNLKALTEQHAFLRSDLATFGAIVDF
jgi:putative ABC transport system substrate-binding protein